MAAKRRLGKEYLRQLATGLHVSQACTTFRGPVQGPAEVAGRFFNGLLELYLTSLKPKPPEFYGATKKL